MVVVTDNFMKEKKQKCSCFPVCTPTPQCLSVSASILKYYVADIFNQPRLSSPFRCRTLCEYVCVYFFLYILKLIYQQLADINNRLASIKYFMFLVFFLLCFDLNSLLESQKPFMTLLNSCLFLLFIVK